MHHYLISPIGGMFGSDFNRGYAPEYDTPYGKNPESDEKPKEKPKRPSEFERVLQRELEKRRKEMPQGTPELDATTPAIESLRPEECRIVDIRSAYAKNIRNTYRK